MDNLFFVLCDKNVASVNRNLLSFSAHTFRQGVYHKLNTTSKVSVDSFKVPIVRLRAVSVLWGV